MEPHAGDVLTRPSEPLGACAYLPEPLLQIRREAAALRPAPVQEARAFNKGGACSISRKTKGLATGPW